MTPNKLAFFGIGLSVALSLFVFFVGPAGLRSNGKENILGAAGNLLAENYIPYILYNGGYNSAKDMTLSGAFGVSGASTFTGNVTVGSSGTAFAKIIDGTCALTVQLGTIAASTSAPFDCAVTGVVSTDNVVANIATTTGLGVNTSWFVEGAKASSTAGFITVVLRNNVGAAANPSAQGIASSTTYVIIK